ncbi:hypothetical protein COV24_02640 [candidate division WWE3 bacterium CG10_big_fil_rev_8_21_14_0_10_32_10]|uniref:Uncharacterized protein n=1 Tax=candidate division WWE3 bacterium CG10_big_fil_rev_8_21_14_0_10_32_10 TaxID=1975090 RepID=A0A2H0RBL1_UNCKA|nr:MAG: hypothetical protein COV24_02640 [candidate division WWE3 bacterium CG10_big_fil_rev_8_21_14_0_10_32_10]
MNYFKNILAITKKELLTFINNPSLYIVVVVFLFIWEFLFFRNVFLIEEASLRDLYNVLPWIILILAPAITMGLIAKEKEEGTLEWLLTHPVNEIQLLLGKFKGSLIFVTLPLLFPIIIAYSFAPYASMDWGIVFGQVLGSILFAASIISLGIYTSSLFKSQISALLTTIFVAFLFLIIGSGIFTMIVPLSLNNLLENISLISHINSISRGVIDTRDIWYFLSFIAIFMSLSWLQLAKMKFGNQIKKYRTAQTGIYLFMGIAILSNILGSKIPGRIDLTQQKIYTLSGGTTDTLGKLNDIVNIDLYYSELPAQYSPVLRDTKDLLSDYQKNSSNKVKVQVVSISQGSPEEQTAVSQGIQTIQFNTVGQEKFESQKGYLGLVISFAGKQEIIPFIQNTSDLEYEITSDISKLTNKNKKKVAFLSGHGEKVLGSDLKTLNEELNKQFETTTITIKQAPENSTGTQTEDVLYNDIDADISTLVIDGPKQNFDEEERNKIKDFVSKGGNILVLSESYDMNQQTGEGELVPNNVNELIKNYGVTISDNLIYDLKSNETVQYQAQQGFNILAPYPFWVRALPESNNLITSNIKSLVLPWSSSLSINTTEANNLNYEITNLFGSSDKSGAVKNIINLDPGQKFSEDNLGIQVLAVMLKNKGNTDTQSSNNKAGNIIVIGDSDLFVDGLMQRSPQNIAFGLNAISWLSQEKSLAGIKIKGQPYSQFEFKDKQKDSAFIKYVNLALAVLIPSIFGVYRMYRRKKLKSNTYEE